MWHGFHGAIWLEDASVLYSMLRRYEFLFLAIWQAVVPSEFVKVMLVLLIEQVIIQKCYGKMLCYSLDLFPTGQAEVKAKCEAARQEEVANNKQEGPHNNVVIHLQWWLGRWGWGGDACWLVAHKVIGHDGVIVSLLRFGGEVNWDLLQGVPLASIRTGCEQCIDLQFEQFCIVL